MNEEAVRIARSYLGVRFQDQGRSRKGLDCIGLVVLTFTELGLKVEDQVGYKRTSTDAELRNALLAHLDPKPKEEMEDGDVLFFSRSNSRHIGIAATNRYGQRTVIHASLRDRKVVETPLSQVGQVVKGVFKCPIV